MNIQREEDLLLEFSVEVCACGRKPALKIDDVYQCRICFDRRAPEVKEPKRKEEPMRKITNEELAPKALIEIIEHYVDRLTLEIKEILFIDDYNDERVNAYSDEEKAFCFNFARIPTKACEHGWGNLVLTSALWAVQVTCALETIRIAVQEQYYGFEKMDEEELDRDIELFMGQELQDMTAKNGRLFMPEQLGEMGVIGIRLRDALNEQFNSGGAKEDLAAWTCRGDVNTDEFRKFLKSEAVEALQNQIKAGKMGVFHDGFCFLSIGEYVRLTCDEQFLTEDAAVAHASAAEKVAEVCNIADDLKPGLAEHAKEVIEEGTMELGFAEPDLGTIAGNFKDLTNDKE